MSDLVSMPQPASPTIREHRHRQLTATGWGLLFVWVGVAIWAQAGWGFGLLGVGVIVLASQMGHQVIGGIRWDVFSVVVGLVFLAGGIWELFSIGVGLVPIVCVLAGVALVLSAVTSKPTPTRPTSERKVV